jgi:hypothetical protein
MDLCLTSSIDGLRAVAAAAADVVVAAGAANDRCSFAIAADVEAAALSALGVGDADAAESPESPEATNRFTALSLLQQLPRLMGIKRESSAAEGASAEETPASAPAVAAENAALIHAQLHPVTDIVVLHAGDPLPEGYQRIEASATGLYAGDLQSVRGRRGVCTAADDCTLEECQRVDGTAYTRRRARPSSSGARVPRRPSAGIKAR